MDLQLITARIARLPGSMVLMIVNTDAKAKIPELNISNLGVRYEQKI
jgi:hypothetical protein